MKEFSCFEFQQGRLFAGRLPHGGDLINTIAEFCKKALIQMATFSVIGAVSSATIGAYDQKQQVYVTFKEEAPLERTESHLFMLIFYLLMNREKQSAGIFFPKLLFMPVK